MLNVLKDSKRNASSGAGKLNGGKSRVGLTTPGRQVNGKK